MNIKSGLRDLYLNRYCTEKDTVRHELIICCLIINKARKIKKKVLSYLVSLTSFLLVELIETLEIIYFRRLCKKIFRSLFNSGRQFMYKNPYITIQYNWLTFV